MQDQSATVAAVVPRVMDNYLTFWRTLAGCYDGAVEEADGLVMIATGLPIPFFNPAAILRWPADPVAVVERVRQFAGRHGCQSMLATWGEIATRFEPVARQLGLVDDGAAPEMILLPTDQRPLAALEGLTIEPVTTAAGQRAFADVVAGTYAMPRELASGFEAPALLTAPGIICYVGSVDGRPVATSMLLVTSDVAGVHVVGTLPEYRRRSIGAAMTQRCVDDGW
ncbi:MAG TPA: GNAT family N-acetyltransferase, partial [Thermomicrobiales bacterium]|nr:GNAT family N-acetyltransferase [Thermomicrobiales bacterium]